MLGWPGPKEGTPKVSKKMRILMSKPEFAQTHAKISKCLLPLQDTFSW